MVFDRGGRADARLLALCVILGVTSWTGLCRLLRGETLKLRELEYVQAARAFGVGTATILRRHVLPNVMHIVVILAGDGFSGLVLAEAVLSYVGIGVDPNTISFGTMINAARMELARDPMVWWSLVAAFVVMFVLVLAANLFADVVRGCVRSTSRRNPSPGARPVSPLSRMRRAFRAANRGFLDLALVVLLRPLASPMVAFDAATLVMEVERHQRIARAFDLADELADLGVLEE